MSRKLLLGSFAGLLSVLLSNPSRAQSSPTTHAFYLRDGVRVLFYGNSITAQREYTEDVEEYVLTRFPGWKVTFTNAGISGDRVTGGSTAGPIDLRLSRDVFPMKPDVVTIMLGMNDGYYRAPEPGIESVYKAGYRHIVESIRQSLPLAQLTLIKPSPYDDITRTPAPQGGYNQVLLGYGKFLESFGAEKGVVIADFNEPVMTVLNRIARSSPVLARQFIPDRIHPQRAAHWLMAESLLKAWNAPALVSEVLIDISKKIPSFQGKNTSVADLSLQSW